MFLRFVLIYLSKGTPETCSAILPLTGRIKQKCRSELIELRLKPSLITMHSEFAEIIVSLRGYV